MSMPKLLTVRLDCRAHGIVPGPGGQLCRRLGCSHFYVGSWTTTAGAQVVQGRLTCAMMRVEHIDQGGYLPLAQPVRSG